MEKTTRIILGAAVCVAVLIITTQPVIAGIVNGDFSSGGDGWTTSGRVWFGFLGKENAFLAQGQEEPEPFDSVLSQGVTLLEGENWLSFYLSIDSELDDECDTFTATFDGAEIYAWSNNYLRCFRL